MNWQLCMNIKKEVPHPAPGCDDASHALTEDGSAQALCFGFGSAKVNL